MKLFIVICASALLAGCYADTPLGPNYVQPEFNQSYVQFSALTAPVRCGDAARTVDAALQKACEKASRRP
jgi:outer membrane biogenesis lipoprotein LolB